MVGTWFILLPFFDRGLAAFFFLLFQEMRYGMARVFVTRCFNFSTAFTVDWLIHLREQDLSEVLVLDEISNSQLFSSAYIFNSQTWISTRILRVCKREFRALISRKVLNILTRNLEHTGIFIYTYFIYSIHYFVVWKHTFLILERRLMIFMWLQCSS